MRLLILSDLHVEAAPFVPAAGGFDVAVLAGDIHNGPAALRWARAHLGDRPIVQIAGNHEFFDRHHGECLQGMREAARETGIHFLENESVVIDGVEFLGCTLWTDFRVFESPGRDPSMSAEEAMRACSTLMADYFVIDFGEGAARHRFTPADAAGLHARSRAWLDDALAVPHAGPRVVISHHLPSWRSVAPAYAHAVTNAAFASDLDTQVAGVDLWVHGHTHSSHDYRLGKARVLCNPRGYPSRRRQPAGFENRDFDPALTVRID